MTERIPGFREVRVTRFPNVHGYTEPPRVFEGKHVQWAGETTRAKDPDGRITAVTIIGYIKKREIRTLEMNPNGDLRKNPIIPVERLINLMENGYTVSLRTD